MEDDEDKTIVLTDEDRERIKKEILGEDQAEDTEFDNTSNG